jgi:hypothetical protein
MPASITAPKILNFAICFIASFSLKISLFAQHRVYFKEKKIADLGLYLDHRFYDPSSVPNFPPIWSDFNSDNEEFVFSGYYSKTQDSDHEIMLNGEMKLVRIQMEVREGTQHLKEELIIQYEMGKVRGPLKYNRYSVDAGDETDPSDIPYSKWQKEIILTAFADFYYRDISYTEFIDYERTKITIKQKTGMDISLDYFWTLIRINTAKPDEKPVFKKVKY